MKRILFLGLTLLCFAGRSFSQNVFDAADPIVRYSSAAAYGSAQRPDTNIVGLQKWVANLTNGVSSGSGAFKTLSETYKAYFFNFYNTRVAFRIKYPRSYSNPDSADKKYPVALFLHGAGEVGCPSNGGIYNNEKQLVLGGKLFGERVDNNQFDGFLLYPQYVSGAGCWGEWGDVPNARYNLIMAFLDSMVKYVRADNDRVFTFGLSGGGIGTWKIAQGFPTRISSIAPTSAAGLPLPVTSMMHIPIWFATGGKDTNPTPDMAQYTETTFTQAGANIRRSLYEDLGHASWYRHWGEPDFVKFMNETHKANPLIFFNRFEFCPTDAVNTRLGITSGFYAYEWQKDGVLIARRTGGTSNVLDPASVISFTGNEINIRAFGTYRVRFQRVNGGPWSDWSIKPAVISPKPITQTPPIAITGMRSRVLPALDGSNTVQLQLPPNFLNYQWVRTSDNVIVSTAQIFEAPIGTYKAKYAEPNGCGTEFSPIFKVVAANGSPKPDPAKNLSITALSQTSLRLDWSENTNAGTNETGFEVYRATKAGGPYALVHVTAANVVSYADDELIPNTVYYYKVRSVGEFGAAAATNEASGKTEIDDQLPSAPSGLTYRGSTSTTVTLKWNAATDNVGIGRYDIYANGQKLYSTNGLSFTVANLDSLTTYTFVVKAVDLAGNASINSNQVVGYTHRQGLSYKYYHGSYSNLPNFDNLTPVSQGVVDTVDIGNGIKTQDDNYALYWEGKIYIPESATYTFETYSDDGSKLYIDVPYSFGATALVNNDGAHGAQFRTGARYLTKGYHSIVVTYSEVGGDAFMDLWWSNSLSIARERIPKNFFAIEENPSNTPAIAPSLLVAVPTAYNIIDLSWTDNSADETGFEIVRSTAFAGPYQPIATTAANATTYRDSGLTANTRYFYRLRSASPTGSSDYIYTEAIWRLNNNLNDDNGGGSAYQLNNGSTSASTDRIEGSHSVSFNSSDYLSFNNGNSGFPSLGSYSQRTVAMWIKPSGTSSKRLLFEFGDASNGLGLRFNSDDLVAGIASGGVRSTITYSNFVTGGNWVSNGWNHVAVVFDHNSLTLYLNGVSVASTTNLPFDFIGNSSNASRIGNPSGTNGNNVFNDGTYTNYAGLMDNIYVLRSALTAANILDLKNNPAAALHSSVVTLPAPAAPAVPTGLTAVALSTSTAQIKFNDNSANETGFEIWRASGDKSNNRKIASIAAGEAAQITYNDTTLFANTTYYYTVRATGLTNNSAFTGEVSVTTLNTKPVIEKIRSFTMRYGSTYLLAIKATDPDGGVLTFTAPNVPTFGTVSNPENGLLNISFSPAITRIGAYAMIVYVQDANGGKDSTLFTLTVNTNDVPVLSAVSESYNLVEGGSVSIPLSGTDKNGTARMLWEFEGLPSFATFTNNNNGTGTLQVQPGFSAAGVYNVRVTLHDGYGAWTSRSTVITVTDRDPEETVYVDFRVASTLVPLWNSVIVVNPGISHGTLVDIKSRPTTVALALTKGSVSYMDQGAVTGNNSGVFPDNVMKDFMRWGFNVGNNLSDTLIMRVSGLDAIKQYDFTFHGSYTINGDANSVTKFRIGNQEVFYNYLMNTSQARTISGVQPNSAGEVFITMIGDAHTARGGVLSGMIISSNFDDGLPPAKPTGLTGQHTQQDGVRLQWTDIAFNEQAYNVYRATVKAGPYTLLNPGATNRDSTGYSDVTTSPETTYYYYVAGRNNSGIGASSDTVKVVTGNNVPVITTPSTTIFAKTGATQQFDFTVTDDPGETVTVTIGRKPSFVTLENLGGSNYRLQLAPGTDHIGWFELTLIGRDNKGAEATKTIALTIADKNTRSVFINIGGSSAAAATPWNNIAGTIASGRAVANLRDEQNAQTSIGIQFGQPWPTLHTLGHITGNNSGVYPDAVLQGGVSDIGGPRTITFTGLDNTKRYNIVVVGSVNEGTDGRIVYASGTVTDTLNARYNTRETGNLNGLTPSNGSIVFTATRLGGTVERNYLNAIVLEEYDPSTVILNPINLYAEPFDRTSVNLSWSDRTRDEAANDGYVLERATDSLFTQNVVTEALPANTSTYRSQQLMPNVKYWFRLRAKTAGGMYSDYSNRAKAITPASIVSVNFNYTLPDVAHPWNNIFASPTVEGQFDNLINQSGAVSGLSLELTRIFNGEFTAGVNTGNNSGIVPDNALASNFWLDKTQLSQFKLSGLNHSRRYRIGFFGSSSNVGWFKGNYTATYTINGRTVYLNSWMNSTKVVYIDDVVPDAAGNVYLDFSTTADGQYGFNGGIIIQDYVEPDALSSFAVNNLVVASNAVGANDEHAAVETLAARESAAAKTRMYPNPFTESITMDFHNSAGGRNISVEVYDVSGRISYRKNFGKLPAGNNTIKVNAADAGLGTGVYVMTLSADGKAIQAGKVIRAVK